MVAATQEEKAEIVECPNCSTLLSNLIKCMPVKAAGLDIREISGFCEDCDKWVELRQFRNKAGQWENYCYCLAIIKNGLKFNGVKNKIKELPTPAVVLGPGGEYQESYLNNG